MTANENLNQEFSDEFDVLYNNISSNQAPGLDEYEKSLFFTRAQDEVVKSYFSPYLNKVQTGYDGNERRQIDFSMITKSKVYQDTQKDGKKDIVFNEPVFDLRSNTKSVTIDDIDVLMFINEYVEVTRGKNTEDTETENTVNTVRLIVDPITYTEYSRVMSKPFKRPTKNKAWRLIDNTDGNLRSELIVGPTDTIVKYVVRYIKRPRAIILKDLGTKEEHDVTINNQWKAQACELDPILYPEIIQRAVELAWAAYKEPSLSNQITLGQSSGTNIGAVQSQGGRRDE